MQKRMIMFKDDKSTMLCVHFFAWAVFYEVVMKERADNVTDAALRPYFSEMVIPWRCAVKKETGDPATLLIP